MVNHQYAPISYTTEKQICDELLWVDFKNGNREAFAVIYHRYCRLLQQTCLTICDDRDLIKDSIHDLFVEIWKNKAGLGLPKSVKAYLLRSIQRKILRHLKKRRSGFAHRHMESVPDIQTVPCVEKKLITEQFKQEQKRDIEKAITVLTRRQQEAVYLRFYANLSYAEIAGKMAISTDSIYNLISKAMDNMQQELVRMPMRTM